MSSDALDIYKDHLDFQMGENAPMTESAIFDRFRGYETEIFGVFDDNVIQDNKDSGNVQQKNKKSRFIISELPFDRRIMTGRYLYLSYRDKTYKIDYISTDEQGLQVLWLV